MLIKSLHQDTEERGHQMQGKSDLGRTKRVTKRRERRGWEGSERVPDDLDGRGEVRGRGERKRERVTLMYA